MKNAMVVPLVLAAMPAVGNALFAYGQIRASQSESLFLYIAYTLGFCVVLFAGTMMFLPKSSPYEYLISNFVWIVVGGLGYFLTFTGFYFLYTKFGASYYSLYAVLSIITTSIVVGLLVFRESFNLYYGLAVGTAVLTVVLFALGQSRQAATV